MNVHSRALFILPCVTFCCSRCALTSFSLILCLGESTLVSNPISFDAFAPARFIGLLYYERFQIVKWASIMVFHSIRMCSAHPFTCTFLFQRKKRVLLCLPRVDASKQQTHGVESAASRLQFMSMIFYALFHLRKHLLNARTPRISTASSEDGVGCSTQKKTRDHKTRVKLKARHHHYSEKDEVSSGRKIISRET